MKKIDPKVSTVYPRFIIDKPEGKDLLEGKSQETLTENISQFIIENEQYKRKVIGIEGEWGSGKSNVIEILKDKLKKDYYFYVFDAWGHQEDLTRRSILEGLLSKLINNNVLKGDINLWNKELKTLLAKKIDREQKNIPKLSLAVLLSVLGIILMPATKFIAESYLRTYVTPGTATIHGTNPGFFNYIIAGLILFSSFIFLIGWVLYTVYKEEKGKRKKVFEEIFYIYKGEEIINTSEETISESEPTVLQFTKFLKKLEIGAVKKLVIVFDNMDRLPAPKVKEIWSSIHTFFASDDNDLQSWAIVPFDNDHICNIFNEEDKDKKRAKSHADSYIHKTFSIVFHVSPPILSDWQKFLKEKFVEAFGDNPLPEQNVETIFDYYHLSEPKIKPRDIICYINDLVALKKLKKNEIEMQYLCLFALKRMEIMKNPFEQIMSRDYLGTLATIFTHDDKLDKNISALAFNVELDKADEILLKRPIQKALRGEGALTQLSKQKGFLPIFDSVFYNTNYDIIPTTNCLESLSENIQEENLNKYWEHLSNSIMQIEKFESKYVDAIKTLIQKLKKHESIEKVLKFLFVKVISPDENGLKFTGTKYYNLINEIKTILDEIWKGKPVDELLSDNHVEADEYFEFISNCPNDFEKFKVLCDAKKINNYLIERFIVNGITNKELNYITIIKSRVGLEDFKKKIEETIPTLTATLANYQDILTNIIDIGKTLSTDGKFTFDIPESIVTPLLTANPTHPRIMDILQLIISSNVTTPNPEHIKNAEIIKLFADTNLIEPFIKSYSYYFNYSDLVKYYLQFPSTLIKEVIIKLTNSSDKLQGSDVVLLISKYSDIKSKLFNDDIALCNSFVSKIDSFYQKNGGTFITSENLSNAIQFSSDNLSNDCQLVNDFVQESVQFINILDKSIWVEALKDTPNSNYIKIFKKLVETNKYQIDKLPHQLDEAYKETMIAVSKKDLPVPTTEYDLWDKLYEMHTVPFNQTFKTVRDNLISPSNDDVQIEQLLFFEKGLFNQGGLDDSPYLADEFLRRVLTPLVSENETYRNVLKRNIPSLRKIVEKAYPSIMEFNTALAEKCPEIFDDEFRPVSDVLLSKIKSIKEAENFSDTL